MSKYDPLWKHLEQQSGDALTLTFAEIERLAGAELDHSFLRYKKELAAYGWQVEKISMKRQTVRFKKLEG